MNTTLPPKPNWFQTWLTAVRPFSFPASTMPVIFGSVAAAVFTPAPFKWGGALLALFGMVALHAAANLWSDVNDYRRGLDRVPTPVSGALVRGWITVRQTFVAAWVFLLLGGACGALLAFQVGLPLWILGGVGVLIGVGYTARPLQLKYHALGDLAVFLDFGILGALGAWVVQTGQFDWRPVLWAVPFSLLVIGILHANNWRDIVNDGHCAIRTVANLLGDRGSLIYYGLLVFAPFVIILALIALRLVAPAAWLGLPWTFLVTLLAVPSALRCWRKALRRRQPAQPLDFVALDGATAQLNLQFGLLCTVALLLHACFLP
jgi:1,4-dihydroxy-2-naphthoate octaprenyltransferase